MANFMQKLRKLDGAVMAGSYDPLMNCLRSPMPSVNWSFGIKGGGLPFGYSMVLYGPPKGGKSLLANAFTGHLHKTDPDAIAITFNTELRGQVQCNVDQMKLWGIDPDRYQVFDVNTPDLVFDRIENDIAALCDEGAKIKLINIDSLTALAGRRTMDSTSVMDQQIGDHAQTVSVGLKRILPIIRKYGIALILTDHVRAEMDRSEQMRGNTVKMASSWATKHVAEFFCYVEPNKAKAGRVDLSGNTFESDEVSDFMDKSQKTGNKIRFTVKDSSFGKPGRTAEFTLHFEKGIINTHEEVFTLGMNYDIIERPSNSIYKYKETTWKGIASILQAIADDKLLYNAILNDVWMKEYGVQYIG